MDGSQKWRLLWFAFIIMYHSPMNFYKLEKIITIMEVIQTPIILAFHYPS